MYFGATKRNTVTLPHSEQRIHAFLGEDKGNVKKLPARNKIA